jgi:FG-GAP-like repeat/FG-GAP repeat
MHRLGLSLTIAALMQLGFVVTSCAVEFDPPVPYAVGTSPSAAVVADFNGDGKVDLAVLNSGSNNVSILLGNGDGTFQPTKNFDAGTNPSGIAEGDFNGDDKPDLIVFLAGNSSNSTVGEVRILLGNGDGTFRTPVKMTLAVWAAAVTVGDFNGDKKADLIVGNINPNTSTATLQILLGKGDGTFQAAKAVQPDFRTPHSLRPISIRTANWTSPYPAKGKC